MSDEKYDKYHNLIIGCTYGEWNPGLEESIRHALQKIERETFLAAARECYESHADYAQFRSGQAIYNRLQELASLTPKVGVKDE